MTEEKELKEADDNIVRMPWSLDSNNYSGEPIIECSGSVVQESIQPLPSSVDK